MRAVVSSANSWHDKQTVINAVCELPPGTTVLLPSKKGACAVVQNHAEELKIETEDWSDEDYDTKGSKINSDMLKTDIDFCIVFLAPGAHAAKDCLRRARNMDIDVRVYEQ